MMMTIRAWSTQLIDSILLFNVECTIAVYIVSIAGYLDFAHTYLCHYSVPLPYTSNADIYPYLVILPALIVRTV